MASFDKIPLRPLVSYRVSRDSVKPFFALLRERKITENESGERITEVTKKPIKEDHPSYQNKSGKKRGKSKESVKGIPSAKKSNSTSKTSKSKTQNRKKIEKKLKKAKI